MIVIKLWNDLYEVFFPHLSQYTTWYTYFIYCNNIINYKYFLYIKLSYLVKMCIGKMKYKKILAISLFDFSTFKCTYYVLVLEIFFVVK